MVLEDEAVALDDLLEEPKTTTSTSTTRTIATTSEERGGGIEATSYDPLLLGLGLHPKGGLEVSLWIVHMVGWIGLLVLLLLLLKGEGKEG